jgi:DNA-binding NtrC family response regulator
MEKTKILLLEDNPNDAELIQLAIKKSGMDFYVKEIQTRTAYTDALDAYLPDIILSDYSLPSFDGVSAFRIKKEKYPDVPFIIVSGTLGDERSVELIKLGVTDYVLKNNLVSLSHKIERALKDASKAKAKRLADEKLRFQHEKLMEIAFLQSHQVRVPVAHILGLFEMFNFDDPADPENASILHHLKETADMLDKIIHQIVQKTNEIQDSL